jgi:hypothetical protein
MRRVLSSTIAFLITAWPVWAQNQQSMPPTAAWPHTPICGHIDWGYVVLIPEAGGVRVRSWRNPADVPNAGYPTQYISSGPGTTMKIVQDGNVLTLVRANGTVAYDSLTVANGVVNGQYHPFAGPPAHVSFGGCGSFPPEILAQLPH